MTTILDVPPEILNLILSDVDLQSCVIDLWKCGCRRLNALLARGGCTIVSLVDQKRRTKSRWPKMLSELLHLRSLSINRAQFGLMGSKELGYALQSLSKTLLTLKLVCLEAESCFLLNPPPRGSFRDDSKWRPPASSKTPRMWPISRKFPNLMQLTLETSFPVLLPEDMPYLPSSLTGLEVKNQTNALRDCPSALPRGLVHFAETRPCYALVAPYMLVGLPPGLTHYQRSTVFPADPESVEVLPKSLTSCPGLWVTWDKATAEVIPPFLHTLHIQFNVESPIPFTPYLTDLTCTLIGDWSREILITLPPVLTRLSIANIDWQTLQGKDDLPSALRTLELVGNTGEENLFNPMPNTIVFLPNTLTSFKTWAYDNLEFIPKLPTSLTILQLNLPDDHHPKRQRIYALPPNLREFKADITWTLPPGWSILTKAILQPMKENISSTLLHITLSGWAEPFPAALPRGLLTLDAGTTAFTHKHLALLPRSLTSLKFDRLESMATYEAFATLPRTLKVLAVDRITRDIVSDCFQGLPDYLQFLHFDPSFSLKPSILAFLPPLMTSLEMGLTDVTEEDLGRLPRSLTHINLNVTHSKLNRTVAHCLPPNLDRDSRVLAKFPDFIMTEYHRIETQEYLFPSPAQKSHAPNATSSRSEGGHPKSGSNRYGNSPASSSRKPRNKSGGQARF